MEDIKNILFGGVSPLVTPTGAFNKIELTTLDPVSVKLSSCCKPNPTAKDNCALLTPKGLSVHHKNCERFPTLKFQREDAVNISWKTRQTHVSKKQILHISPGDQKRVSWRLSVRRHRNWTCRAWKFFPVILLFIRPGNWSSGSSTCMAAEGVKAFRQI